MAEPQNRPGAGKPGVPFPTAPQETRPASAALAPDMPEAPVYRPVSGLAVAGLILALAYALVVLVFGAAAFYQGTPLLLGTLNLLAVLAVALSLAGWLQISRSEGTRAGLGLARAGLLLGLVFGLSYAAYYGATYFAIREQADRFVRDWVELIRQGKINHAFLRTLDPAVRQNVNPEDDPAMRARFDAGMAATDPAMGPAGPLSRFKQSELVRLLSLPGDETQVTPGAVQDWGWGKGGYQVVRTYDLRTPEGLTKLNLSVVGHDSKNQEFEKRQWSVVMNDSGVRSRELSELGKEREVQRRFCLSFLQHWGEAIRLGHDEEAYLATRPRSERAGLGAEYAARRAAACLAITPTATVLTCVPAADNLLARELYLKGFSQFADSFAQPDDKGLQADVEDTKKAVEDGMRTLFRPERATTPMQGLTITEHGVYPWSLTKDGRLNMIEKVFIVFGNRYRCDVAVTVEGDAHPPDGKNEPDWRVSRLVFKSGFDRTREYMGQGAAVPAEPRPVEPRSPGGAAPKR